MLAGITAIVCSGTSVALTGSSDACLCASVERLVCCNASTAARDSLLTYENVCWARCAGFDTDSDCRDGACLTVGDRGRNTGNSSSPTMRHLLSAGEERIVEKRRRRAADGLLTHMTHATHLRFGDTDVDAYARIDGSFSGNQRRLGGGLSVGCRLHSRRVTK